VVLSGYASVFTLIDSNRFTNNEICIRGANKKVTNSVFERNQIAVKWWYIGIELKQWSSFSVIIRGNSICNKIINVKTLSDKGVDLTGNCWCTSDSSEIEAGLIDGYDEIRLGLFNYDIYDEDCSTIISSVVKDPSVEVQEPSRPDKIGLHSTFEGSPSFIPSAKPAPPLPNTHTRPLPSANCQRDTQGNVPLFFGIPGGSFQIAPESASFRDYL